MNRNGLRLAGSVVSCVTLLGAGAASVAAAPATQASRPTTAPTTGPAADPLMAAIAAVVDQKVKVLADGTPDERQVADDFLFNLPPQALPVIEAAAKRPGLEAAVKQRLEKIAERRRPLDKRYMALGRQQQEDYEWNLKTALDAYDRVGNHDPKWDELARQGIREFTSRKPEERAAAFQTLEHVTTDLKCEDPLVVYFDARVLEAASKAEPDRQKRGKLLNDAVNTYGGACHGFDKYDYPADRKCAAYTHEVSLIYESSFRQVPQAQAEAKRSAGLALKVWPDAAKESGIPARFLSEAADGVVEAQVHTGADRGTVTDQVFEALNDALPKSPVPLVFMGRHYTQWAWDARGGGFANTVAPDGWKKMHERLTTAEDVLSKAYDRDPSDPAAATAMLTVELGQGQGKAVMEKWFKRAIAADPDHQPAYTAKLYYLEPKWYGTPDEMLAFGRECVQTRNWRGDIPWMLVRAHQALAGYTKDPEAYWHQPAVWQDVESVVVPPVKMYPQNVRANSLYAYWAWRCGQWAKADAQFKRLGDHLDTTPWPGGKPAADKAGEEAAAKAAEALQ